MSWQTFCSTVDDSYFFTSDEIKNAFRQKIVDFHSTQNLTRAAPKPSYVTCRKCNSNSIWLDVKQVRSGDEGATTFAECSKCKAKWTMN